MRADLIALAGGCGSYGEARAKIVAAALRALAEGETDAAR